MPEALTEEEKNELEALQAEFAGEDGDDDSDSDSDTDSEADSDEVDKKGNLKGFIVNDDESETEAEVAEGDEDDLPGPSEPVSKGKGKAKQSKKPKSAKKGKGRKEKKDKTKKKKKKSAMTLAELKKLGTRSKSARKRYMERIRKDFVSSAKLEKTMEALKAIMEDRPDEKVSCRLNCQPHAVLQAQLLGCFTNSEPEQRQPPQKYGELCDIIANDILLKVLIFSQWTSLLDLLEVPIDGEDWEYRRYDGSTSSPKHVLHRGSYASPSLI